ncbi:hypothetical protein C0995_016355 [Termitomyces sp. Mi166|nr:hypothetical protein C0995_016355 [Termitomyces sp. Mi166\
MNWLLSFVGFFDLLQHASEAQMDSKYNLTKDYPAVPMQTQGTGDTNNTMPEHKMSSGDAEKVYTEEELVNNYGFELIDWDGFEAVPLVDAADDAFWAIVEEGEKAGLDASAVKHKHGAFSAFNIGYTYGIGNQVPSKWDNKSYNAMLDCLIQNPGIQCLMTYGSASVQLWVPQLYKYMDTHLQWLYNKLKKSELSLSSVFFSMEFNFGGKV